MGDSDDAQRPEEVDPNTAEGFLALARHGRLTQVRELLATLDEPERRERLQAEDAHGNTALLLAIAYEYPNVASMLLQHAETDPMHTNARGYTALSLAARSNRPFVVSAVLHRLLSVERLRHGELAKRSSSSAALPALATHLVSSSSIRPA